jgi:hypothetical protein
VTIGALSVMACIQRRQQGAPKSSKFASVAVATSACVAFTTPIQHAIWFGLFPTFRGTTTALVLGVAKARLGLI